jgi:NTE family protein
MEHTSVHCLTRTISFIAQCCLKELLLTALQLLYAHRSFIKNSYFYQVLNTHQFIGDITHWKTDKNLIVWEENETWSFYMKQKVSLVLSGGGARGIAHIGVLEELEEQGYSIGSITGTSMGALVGGIYAMGKLDEFKSWLLTLDKLKVFALVDFTFSSQGLIKGDKVFNRMKKFISDRKIEDLEIPYAAVAVDLLNKKEVVFKKGSILEAIRASIAIPTIFTPVNKENALLVDGGVLNNIPTNHAKRFPKDLLVAVNVNADIPLVRPAVVKKEIKARQSIYWKKISEFQSQLQKSSSSKSKENLGYFDLINKTISLMTEHIAQTTIESHPPDILINISKKSCGTFDFFKAEELVEIGRHSARKILEDYKRKSYIE